MRYQINTKQEQKTGETKLAYHSFDLQLPSDKTGGLAMGYSTTQIDKSYAQALAVGKEVVSATLEEYFNDKKWFKNSVSYDLGDNNRLYITLANGDFVEIQL